jgi:hypothetical protein
MKTIFLVRMCIMICFTFMLTHSVSADVTVKGTVRYWDDSILNSISASNEFEEIEISIAKLALSTYHPKPNIKNYFEKWNGIIRSSIPSIFELSQNFPNPFNPTTTINYSLPRSGDVRLVVSDYLGREVAVLAEGLKAAGMYDVQFDASRLASGVYFYSIRVGSYSVVKRMMLLK